MVLIVFTLPPNSTTIYPCRDDGDDDGRRIPLGYATINIIITT